MNCNKHQIEMTTRLKRGRPTQKPYVSTECRLCENERKGFPINDPSNPKYQSRWKARTAVRRGKIQKPLRCEGCGVITILEGHHPDYTKPLKVVWLCRSCHNGIR